MKHFTTLITCKKYPYRDIQICRRNAHLLSPLLNLKQRIITDRLKERGRATNGNVEHIFTCDKATEL